MKGGDILIECLKAQGVRCVFGDKALPPQYIDHVRFRPEHRLPIQYALEEKVSVFIKGLSDFGRIAYAQPDLVKRW